MSEITELITQTLVPAKERLNFLPKYFGTKFMMRFERRVYDYMKHFCPSYMGGYWEYVELSNGGCYMSLSEGGIDTRMRVEVAGNGFSQEMGIEAASIVANLFALNDLANTLAIYSETDLLADRYWALRDFALQHSECDLILQAID